MAERKSAAQTPVSRETAELDRRLLDTLAAHEGPAGICPRVPRLASLLDVSVSTVQRSLRRLVEAGLIERVPVYERDDDVEWKQRLAAGFCGERPRRQTSNSYRVTPGPGVTPKTKSAAQTPVSRVVRDTPERGDLSTPPVGGTTPASDDDEQDRDTGVAHCQAPGECWPAYANDLYYQGPGRLAAPPRRRQLADPPIALHVPKAEQLDHDPKQSEILAALRAGLGEAEVLEVRRHPTYRNTWGKTLDLETCSAKALHGAVVNLEHGDPAKKKPKKGRAES